MIVQLRGEAILLMLPGLWAAGENIGTMYPCSWANDFAKKQFDEWKAS